MECEGSRTLAILHSTTHPVSMPAHAILYNIALVGK